MGHFEYWRRPGIFRTRLEHDEMQIWAFNDQWPLVSIRHHTNPLLLDTKTHFRLERFRRHNKNNKGRNKIPWHFYYDGGNCTISIRRPMLPSIIYWWFRFVWDEIRGIEND